MKSAKVSPTTGMVRALFSLSVLGMVLVTSGPIAALVQPAPDPETTVAPAVSPSGKPKFLVFGKTGWIGGMLGELLTSQGDSFVKVSNPFCARGWYYVALLLERHVQRHAPRSMSTHYH